IIADITFDETDFLTHVKFTHSFAGLSAMGVREAITFTPKENEKELMLNFTAFTSEESEIEKYEVVNKGLEHYTDNKPIKIIADIKTDKLIQKSGSKYIFKVGDVIGRQEEMYQTKARQLPISIAYTHQLERTITINIPKGYKISNPEVVNMNIDFGKEKYGFVSSYQLQNNKLIIHIMEHYGNILYDKSEIENYKKVINAAADFNKKSLIFEKI